MTYQPELGQAFFGNPWGEYETPEYVDALLDTLVAEMERVHWNTKQQKLNEYVTHWFGRAEMRSYFWGEDAEQAALPNFAFDGVEIRWYKYRGRGQTSNVEMDPAGWVDWFNRCLAEIRSIDTGYEG